MIIDTESRAFRVPEDKKQKMTTLRIEILGKTHVPLRLLQRWTGKCVSLMCAVPEARMFIREANAAISRAIRKGTMIYLTRPLREEIGYWEFLDHWQGVSPWRREGHTVISLSTDASLSGYAIVDHNGDLITRDSWKEGDTRPIHVKEAEAVLTAIRIAGASAKNERMLIKVDNKAVIDAWSGYGGSRDPSLNNILKRMWGYARLYNVDLSLKYVSSSQNAADEMSRHKSLGDCTLDDRAWKAVEAAFGPHSTDGMAMESNRKTPRFLSPFPCPDSAGVDFFAQPVETETNLYVYPPFIMIPAVLAYLRERGCEATVVLPAIKPHPAWWPLVKNHGKGYITLGYAGEKGVFATPSSRGFAPNKKGLENELRAYRLDFTTDSRAIGKQNN